MVGYYSLMFLLYDTLGSYWITPPTFMIVLLQICNLRCYNQNAFRGLI